MECARRTPPQSTPPPRPKRSAPGRPPAPGPDPRDAIVLASGSPRRRELLSRAGVVHEVIPPDVDEHERPGESPGEMAVRLAREKAFAVARRIGATTPRWVLGADTIVVLEDLVLGKPVDADDARRMLSRLTGGWHRVVTGVAVVHTASERSWTLAVTSRVRMRAATREEIDAYVATGEPLDKAGSYGIQGEGGRRFVSHVEGSESNVMGLPVEETLDLLERAAREHAADGEARRP